MPELFSNMIRNRCVQAAAFVLTVLSIGAGFYAVDDRYAKACVLEEKIEDIQTDVALLGQLFNEMRLIQRRDAIQERIWALEKYYGGVNLPNAPQPVRDEYYHLKRELQDINQRLQK
jgi:phosphoglycerate-specific signal transduction histidine kinase